MTTEVSVATKSHFVDPFNYPMPNRRDLMSLSTITAKADHTKVTTHKFISTRATS